MSNFILYGQVTLYLVVFKMKLKFKIANGRRKKTGTRLWGNQSDTNDLKYMFTVRPNLLFFPPNTFPMGSDFHNWRKGHNGNNKMHLLYFLWLQRNRRTYFRVYTFFHCAHISHVQCLNVEPEGREFHNLGVMNTITMF